MPRKRATCPAMFNDISSLRSHLATRRPGKARDMIAPGPDTAELRAIIALALRTPDPGQLAPWRLVTIAADPRATFAARRKDVGTGKRGEGRFGTGGRRTTQKK